MGGSSSAPTPDPNIGIAALKSAEVGEQLLGWMQDRSKVTDQWATEDRARWKDTFQPLQDQYIADAKSWDTPQRRAQAASEAQADVRLQGRLAAGQRVRQAMSMGVNPNSGRFLSAEAGASNDMALAAVGAGNLARDKIEAQGESKMANAINLGSGLAVNPATSMQLGSSALSTGANGAMQGYSQQGNLLNTQYQQQMQAYQADQQNSQGLFGAIGTIAGMVSGNPLAMLSSKDAKTDKRKIKSGAALGALREMPVEEWTYKDGMGDGERHVGPYAEDFHKATGRGDGKSIPIQDAIGLTMGAVRDVDDRLDKIERKAA